MFAALTVPTTHLEPLMDIGRVTFPSVEGEPPDEAVRILYESLCAMWEIVTTMNDEIERLKADVEDLRSTSG